MPRRREGYIVPVDEKTIGARLRDLRKRRGLTQSEIAAKTGVDQTLVSDYERGTVRMHAALLAAFAQVLRTSADEVLGLREIKENGSLRSRRILQRVQLIDKLPVADQKAVLRFLDALLERHHLRSPSKPRRTS